MASSSLIPRLFAWRAGDPASVRRLVAGTGSVIDARGNDLYLRLIRNAAHVASVLDMLTGWDLEPLERDLARLNVPLVAVASAGDRAVRPAEARRVASFVPGARAVLVPRLGHLAHEEEPAQFVALIESLLDPATATPTGGVVPAAG